MYPIEQRPDGSFAMIFARTCHSAIDAIADMGTLGHSLIMRIIPLLTYVLLLPVGSACAPSSDATACRGWSSEQYIELARAQKGGMLSRSVKTNQANFASDEATVADDPTGYVAKVIFNGKDGHILTALIDADCYVGWTTT